MPVRAFATVTVSKCGKKMYAGQGGVYLYAKVSLILALP